MLWQCSSYRCIFLETLLLTQTSLRNIQLFNFAVWATAGVKAQSDPCHRCKCVRGQWAGLIIQTNFCPVQDHPVSTQMTTSNLSTLPYFVQLFHFPFFLSCVLVSWWKCNERRASEGMKNSLIVFSGGGKESRGRNKNLMSWGSVRQYVTREIGEVCSDWSSSCLSCEVLLKMWLVPPVWLRSKMSTSSLILCKLIVMCIRKDSLLFNTDHFNCIFFTSISKKNCGLFPEMKELM